MPTAQHTPRLASKFASHAKAIAALTKDEWPYVVCAAIALVVIWGHRFPAGVDIPQHANLFRVSREMTLGPSEFRGLYQIAPFTPYLLAYALAYPFALLFGAIAAVKCLLTLVALATPLTMRFWLRSVGARPEFGLLGFLVAFDLQYYWGFVSHQLAMPLAFVYLATFERQGARPGWRAILKTLLAAMALFFSHGITYGVLTLIVGARLLLRRHPFAAWRAGLHALPAGFVAVVWSLLNRRYTGRTVGDNWVDLDRLILLFSAPFGNSPSKGWAVVSVIGIVVILLTARPRFVLQGRRLVPIAVSTALFLLLPDTVADTSLVGLRFCVYVHAFAPALLHPKSTGLLGRAWGRTVLLWVAFVLVALNQRLVAFNQEISGLWELRNRMQPGFDVRSMLRETSHHSDTVGFMEFFHAAGWVTADLGGILDNDSPDYYQMPIRHGSMPFPSFFRYTIARGDVAQVASEVAAKWKSARLIHKASSWLLFEEPPIQGRDFTVVRFMQSWGQLQSDRAVSGGPLIIGRRHYPQGLGTHADSFIRIRLKRAGRAFAGACGVDAQDGARGSATFIIRDDSGKLLFESGELRGGGAARPFSILLSGRKELVLEVRKVDTIDHAQGDWVDLRLTPL